MRSKTSFIRSSVVYDASSSLSPPSCEVRIGGCCRMVASVLLATSSPATGADLASLVALSGKAAQGSVAIGRNADSARNILVVHPLRWAHAPGVCVHPSLDHYAASIPIRSRRRCQCATFRVNIEPNKRPCMERQGWGALTTDWAKAVGQRGRRTTPADRANPNQSVFLRGRSSVTIGRIAT